MLMCETLQKAKNLSDNSLVCARGWGLKQFASFAPAAVYQTIQPTQQAHQDTSCFTKSQSDQQQPSTDPLEAKLLHSAEEAAGLLELRVAIAEVPANDGTGLGAADDAPGVELELEDARRICRVRLRRDVRVVVGRRLRRHRACARGCRRGGQLSCAAQWEVGGGGVSWSLGL